MPKKVLIAFLAQTSGYCCHFAYVRAHKDMTRKELAEKLGVSESTVQSSRSMVRDGLIICTKCDGCMKHLVDID